MASEIILDEQLDQSLASGDVDEYTINFGVEITINVTAGEAEILFEDHNGDLLTGTTRRASGDAAFSYDFHLMRNESRNRERPEKVLISGTQDSTQYNYREIRSQ